MIAVGATLLLAACGNNIQPSKTSYGQHGLVAILKGSASGAKTVSYKADDESGKVTIHGGTYAITLPVDDKTQTVKLTAGNASKSVKIKAAQTLGDYKTSAAKYNQAIVGMALPKDVQKLAGTVRTYNKQKMATMSVPERMAAMQQIQTVQNAMKQATVATKDQQLPATAKAGITQIAKVGQVKVRANVAESGKLIGYAVIVPTKAMKNKTESQKFGLTLGLLGNSVGVNTKKVMKQFQKQTKGQNKSQTTIKTIKNNGVKFNIGFSTSDLYIYITK